MSFHPPMLNFRQAIRALVGALFLFAAAHAPLANAQNFTLTSTGFTPAAGVDSNSQAVAVINVSTTNNYTGAVALTCAVQGATPLPVCTPSPTSVTPNATPSITVTTGGVAPGTYPVTVTGTSGGETESVTLYLNVVATPAAYTMTVSTAINPGTVSSGFGANATITVTPIASYSGQVTLSCLSITPPVEAAPYCSFQNATNTGSTVSVSSGAPATAMLTINTYGIVQNQTKRTMPRIFYALWFAVPGVALAGMGAGRRHRKKLLGLLLLLIMATSVLVLPSCSATKTVSNNSNGLVTPKNTYTVTLTGVDANGISPSNTTTSTTAATVSLTVN